MILMIPEKPQKKILAKLERPQSSTSDPLQMLLFSEFSSGFFHTLDVAQDQD
jgi:hypothetical protein